MSLSDVAAVVLMALAVFLPKGLPILLLGNHIPAVVRVWLWYVAPAVLAALIAPAIVRPVLGPTFAPLDLLPFAASGATALATRRMLLSLAAGLLVLVLLQVVRGPSA